MIFFSGEFAGKLAGFLFPTKLLQVLIMHHPIPDKLSTGGAGAGAGGMVSKG